MLKYSGVGTLILSSYGAIHECHLAADEMYMVDTGHLVASRMVSVLMYVWWAVLNQLFSGEGLVVNLTRPGRVFMKTRGSDAFLTWLIPQVQRRLPREHH